MKVRQLIKSQFLIKKIGSASFFSAVCAFSLWVDAAPVLEKEVELSNSVLYFNGTQYASTSAAYKSTADLRENIYDYMYGRAIAPHGDAIKVYKQYVFMTWYRGGKFDRHLMLTRYNTETGSIATIEFPHRHTGYQNRWWVGETHNTISLGLSPKNQSIHMVFDQHSLSATNPADGTAANDYFKYYYSKSNALTVPDSEFTLDLFVKDTYFSGNDSINAFDNPTNEIDEYKHITLTGEINSTKFANLTYPKFFLTNEGDLFLYMRKGRSENGRFSYIKYDGEKWQSSFRDFNYSEAKNRGFDYNYGVYGEMKYTGGKIRIGFQQRANVSTDRYVYQNGFFGAYSDDPAGNTSWKNYKDEPISTPLLDTNLIKISEPGDVVAGNETNRISMVGGFDWNVTERGDVHFIAKVVDTLAKKITYVHTYRKAGATEFTTSTDFSGADELYAAGNNIYIIGLTSQGRPYVELAAGGQNNFTRVYEETSGRQFEKGVPYIHEGKLYYYLLEKHDGSNPVVRTSVLKVIDLDLANSAPEVDLTPEVSFANSTLEVVQGYSAINISVNAKAAQESRSIAKVALYLNDVLVSEITEAPYVWTESSVQLLGLAVGEHTFKAVAVDNAGETSSTTMKLTVKSLAQPPIISFPQSDVTLVEGFPQFTFTLSASSPVVGNTIKSVTLYIDGNLVRVDTRSPWNFGHSLAPHETGALGWLDTHTPNPNPLSVGEHIFSAVALDSAGLKSTATMKVAVLEREPAPVVNFNESDIELPQGYGALSVSASIETANENVSVQSASLYIDGRFIRTLFEAPFVWGDVNYEAELLGLSQGSHEFKLVVEDTNNKVGETSMLVTISEPPPVFGDFDADRDVDANDVKIFSLAVRANKITDLAYDFNKDGRVSSYDVRGLALLCTRTGCGAE